MKQKVKNADRKVTKQISVRVERSDYLLLRNEAIRTGGDINSILKGLLSKTLNKLRKQNDAA